MTDGKDLWMVGGGLPLFARPAPKAMRLTAMTPFDNGMIALSYDVVR